MPVIDPPYDWGQLITVPVIPQGEIGDDEQFLRQAAEYIVSAVELSVMSGGSVEMKGQPVLVHDLVLTVLNAIYEGSKQP